MATIDEDLATLEKDIRQLKVEYDQYFGGGRKRPPTEIEWRIDMMVKRYAERGGDLKFAQRFRLNNLSQTYAKYKDIFRKRTAQKEKGSRRAGSCGCGRRIQGISHDLFRARARSGKGRAIVRGVSAGQAIGWRTHR